MPGHWRKPRPERERLASAGSAVLAQVGNLMGRVQARFEGASEGPCFGLTAERHGMLIEPDLPLGLCHFFYQDLQC